jgi:hypothetical protein
MFELPAERTADRVNLIRTWVPRVAMSLFFLSFGNQKFTERYWVQVFAKIGLGDWFRYFTGGLQIAGVAVRVEPAQLFGRKLPVDDRQETDFGAGVAAELQAASSKLNTASAARAHSTGRCSIAP